MKPHTTNEQGDARAGRFEAERLRGILLPCTTPFAESGRVVDTRALGGNIERWNETGIAGYIILGSTSNMAMVLAGVRVLEASPLPSLLL